MALYDDQLLIENIQKLIDTINIARAVALGTPIGSSTQQEAAYRLAKAADNLVGSTNGLFYLAMIRGGEWEGAGTLPESGDSSTDTEAEGGE